MPTEIIAGDFELDRAKLLGKGAWGEVFIGKQVSLNRPVAIKILKKELTADPDFVRRFRREAECLAKLAEEHIIQVYSAGEYDGSPYFIMEFVQGVSLADCMKNNRIFSIEDIIHVAVSVAKAFKAAWNSPAQIVHRDIKPANIMVSFTSSIISPSPEKAEKSASMMSATINIKDAQVKVMDFGLAKLAEGGDHEATMVGTVIGTPKYISPEQGMGNAADIRSDIYSLGIVLYEMATGKIPFEGESAMSMIRHHIYDTALMISQRMQDFPPALEAIVMKCIQKAPESRYETPAKLLEDLDAFEKNKPLVHATVDPDRAAAAGMDATMLAPGLALRRKNKQKVMMAVGIVSGAVILAGLVFWQPWKKELPATTPGMTGGTDISDASLKQGATQDDALLKDIQEKYKLANDLYKEGQWDDSLAILGVILDVDDAYEPARILQKEIRDKINERNEKLRLADAMITDTLTAISAVNENQREFNYIVGRIEKNDYATANKRAEKLSDGKDPIVAPAALYLQMRIWSMSLAPKYLDEMTSLLDYCKSYYPDSSILPLAEKLYKNAYDNSEKLAVQKILDNSARQPDLSRRLAGLEVFIDANQSNQFIQLVKDRRDDTLGDIEAERKNNYESAIAQARRQLDGQLFQNAYDTLKKARQYVNDGDYREIEELNIAVEQAFLAFQGIEPAAEPVGLQPMVFNAITNTKDAAAMALIPAGEFTRGDEKGAPEEKPVMRVRLDSFYADKFEITNGQFRKFVEAARYTTDAEIEGYGWVYNDGMLDPVQGACWKDPKGDNNGIEQILNHPVVQVSWKDAAAYAKWAGKRLLTEAEWEKMARSDQALVYPWKSERYPAQSANIGEDGPGRTAPVGSYENDRSPYGCFDLAGNAAEWCADWHDASYYQQRLSDNPKGPAAGVYRVIRGGSWISSAPLKLTSRRKGFSPPHEKSTVKDPGRFWSDYLGFRCARDVVTLTK